MQLNILVLSYIASAAVSGSVAAVAWRRRHLVGARELAFLMLVVAWWLVASAFEVSSTDRSAKIVWAVIGYAGIELAPVLFLLFVLGWTRQDAWPTRPRIALLLVLPIATVAIAATNELHHLLWSSVTLIDAWGVTAVYQHGPWFWIQAAYAYSLVAAGVVALVLAIYRYPRVYSARIRLVIVGSLAPIAGSVLYVAGLDASVHADLSSIAFAAAGLVAAWAVLGSRLLDFVPVSWPTLVESLTDAVVVLDPYGRIAAINPSANRLLGIGGEAVGQAIAQASRAFPELAAVCEGDPDQEIEIQMPAGKPELPNGNGPDPAGATARWFNIRVTSVADGRGREAGCVVVMRDVTEHREMVETIRRLSLTDELTGLLNRRGFTTLAEQQLLTSLRTRNRLWLFFADLDDLKMINDRLGHEAGDRALCEVARILRKGSFREADLVARVGGDEFAILATEISPTDGEKVLKRVDDAVRRANEIPDREYDLSLSAGVAIFDPEHPSTLDALIAEADRGMYRAKHVQRTTRRRAK